jgi:hypothetical protein
LKGGGLVVRCVRGFQENVYAVKEGKRTLGYVEKVTLSKRVVWRIIGDEYRTNHRTRKDAVHMLLHRLAHPKTYATLDRIKAARKRHHLFVGDHADDKGLLSVLERFADSIGYKVEYVDRLPKDYLGEINRIDRTIQLKKQWSRLAMALTLAHELAHHYMYVNGSLLNVSAEETIVEAIAIATAWSWGIDHITFSLEYIQFYESGYNRFKNGKLDFIFAVVYNAYMHDFERVVTGGDV